MITKCVRGMLKIIAFSILVLLLGCLGGESSNDLVSSLDSTEDLLDIIPIDDGDSSDDSEDSDQTDEPVNNLADVIPSAIIATALTNDAGIEASPMTGTGHFLPRVSAPADIAAGSAVFYANSGLAYDATLNHLYVVSSDTDLVYKLDLGSDIVSWFAGGGNLLATYGSTPVSPREVALEPEGIALNGDYAYVANRGAIYKFPKDGSNLAPSEVDFAGLSIYTDPLEPANYDLDGNGIPQTKGLVAAASIPIGNLFGISADSDYLYVADALNRTLRMISIFAEAGQHRVFNYYLAEPNEYSASIYGPVVHDDGSIYAFMYSEHNTGLFRRVVRFPPLTDLIGTDDYGLTAASNFFSGGASYNTSKDGNANTAEFAYMSSVVSLNSLLYLIGGNNLMRIVRDDGSVTSLTVTLGTPSPADSGGNIIFANIMISGEDNTLYALGGQTVVELSLQFPDQ